MKPMPAEPLKKKKRAVPTDPRFFSKCKIFRHVQDYAFLYPKEINEKIKMIKKRRALEDYLVKRGKKKYYVNGLEKELKKYIKRR